MKNVKLESKYKAAKHELKNYQSRNNDLQSQIKKLVNEKNKNRDEYCKGCEKFKAKLEKMESEIDRYQRLNEEAEEALQQSKKECYKLQNEKNETISLTDVEVPKEMEDLSKAILRSGSDLGKSLYEIQKKMGL